MNVWEELLDPTRAVQTGIRGTAYDSQDRDFADAVGIRVVPIGEFFRRGLDDVMAEARAIVGDAPTYVSYDIDFVDPAFAPGTGTSEVGGPNAWQALEVVRALAGLDIAGADLVEVSPPPSTRTARPPGSGRRCCSSCSASWRPPAISTRSRSRPERRREVTTSEEVVCKACRDLPAGAVSSLS